MQDSVGQGQHVDRVPAVKNSLRDRGLSSRTKTPHRGNYGFRGAVGLTLSVMVSAMGGACQNGPSAPVVPTEECLPAIVSAAPLIPRVEKDTGARDIAYSGDLVKFVRDVQEFQWVGKMDGAKTERNSMLMEVKHVDDGVMRFGFRSDFGAPVRVPLTSYLCEKLKEQVSFEAARCPQELRRAIVNGGGLLSYYACASGPCPVGLYVGGKVRALLVESLGSGRLFVGKTRSLLMGQARISKDDGKQSGGVVVPIVLEGETITRAPDIAVDFIDARDVASVKQRLVSAKVSQTEVKITGEETVRSASDGTVISTKTIEEKYPLPSID